jgi:hypothetical protein
MKNNPTHSALRCSSFLQVTTTLLFLISVSIKANTIDDYYGDTSFLNFRANSKVVSKNGATVYGLGVDENGEPLLVPKLELPQGHKFTFWPNSLFEGKYYQRSDGTKRQVRGRYFGRILIDENSGPRELRRKISAINKQRIFIYEWRIDKSDYLLKGWNKEPRDVYYGTPGESFAWDQVNPKKAWTSKLSTEIQNSRAVFLDQNISDINEFCPNFSNKTDERKVSFWIHLFNALSRKESQFDPMVSNFEGNFGDGSLNVTSRGLFQMSYRSLQARRYRNNGCKIGQPNELHDPFENIECAVAIFKAWIKNDGCLSCKNEEGKFRGAARYWSPLRSRYQVPCSICTGGVANIGFKEEIQRETKALPSCQVTASEQ